MPNLFYFFLLCGLDFRGKLAYLYTMTHSIELSPLLNFQVVAVCRKTGKPQFVTMPAPTQADADDFVSDVEPDWIVIRDNSDLTNTCDHCDGDFPVDELQSCAVEPDFRFCQDCADKLRD